MSTQFSVLDSLFENAIKQIQTLKLLKGNQQYQIDLAAANYHRGRFIISHLITSLTSKSDAANLTTAKECLRSAVTYFMSFDKPIDSLKGILSIVQVLTYELSNAKTSLEATDRVLEGQLTFTWMRDELQKLRKTRKEIANSKKHQIGDP